MMTKLRTLLKRPYPLEQPTKWIVLSLVVVGLFVSLFLVIFQPFGTSVYVEQGRAWILWGYGVVTILALLFDILVLPRVFPAVFDEKRWNIFRGICFQFWHILTIGAANMLYAHLIGGQELSAISIFNFFLTALAIGFFPITISALSLYILLLKKYTASSQILNARIISQQDAGEKTIEHSQSILIASESGREKIELMAGDLLLIKSADNYVEVHWAEREQIRTELLRSTLTRIEEGLKSYPYLFRCHRSYLVNINHILKVTGDSHGYQLRLKGIDELVPVSRPNSKKLVQLVV